MEKKRRERINRSLEELKKLVLQSLHKDVSSLRTHKFLQHVSAAMFEESQFAVQARHRSWSLHNMTLKSSRGKRSIGEKVEAENQATVEEVSSVLQNSTWHK